MVLSGSGDFLFVGAGRERTSPVMDASSCHVQHTTPCSRVILTSVRSIPNPRARSGHLGLVNIDQ